MAKVANFRSLIGALVSFVIFLVAVCSLYYMDKGAFVTAEFAVQYAILGAVGAVPIVFRRYFFGFFFLFGALVGYITRNFLSGLQGSFAPTAGVIVNAFIILICAAVGAGIEVIRVRRNIRKARERRQKEQEEEELCRQRDMQERQRRMQAERAAAAAAAKKTEQEAAAEAAVRQSPGSSDPG